MDMTTTFDQGARRSALFRGREKEAGDSFLTSITNVSAQKITRGMQS
jgi:hypothetical protein